MYDVFFFGIVLQSQDFMGIITLYLGLYGATVVLFHIISVVYLWLGCVPAVCVLEMWSSSR